MEIRNFGSKETENFIRIGKIAKRCKWRSVANIAQRKNDMIIFAEDIDDLKIPPINKLKKLSGSLDGFWSIRINERFRVVFKCRNSIVAELKITDYH